jgi:hypothetical protein
LKIEIEIPDSIAMLSKENQDFVIDGLESFCWDATTKYIQGQKEHGGNLWDRDCLSECSKENIDQFWYLRAARK